MADTVENSATATPPAGGDGFTPAQIRFLKIAVVAMGLIIVVSIIAIVARLVYLAATHTSRSSAAAATLEARLPLPPGAVVRQIAISGDRLAVHYEGPAGPGVNVLDLATGRLATRVTLVPEPPR
jgi:hypothetical protein